MIIFLYIYLSKTVFSFYYYDPFQILDCLNKEKENEYELKEIIKYISEVFKDNYAYNEISKNPPQPYFSQNYHKKVDIQKLLNEINTKNMSFYQFYQQINRQVSKFKDLHIDIKFGHKKRQILNDLYSICPIKFYINKINNTNKLFFKLNKYFHYYDQNLIDIIDRNKNNCIISINKINPFDFISEFCENIGSTKNVHGTFTHKFNAHYGYNLGLYPLDKKDLTLEIIYENGQKLILNYIFISTHKIQDLKEKILEDKGKIFINSNYLFNKFLNQKRYEKIDKKLSKLTKEFNELVKNSEIKDRIDKINDLSWDYIYTNKSDNIFKCKSDKNNQVNIYYIQSFSPNNIAQYKEIFLKCVNLFDQNDFPIITIIDKNYGGFADLPKLMLELISPYISIRKFLSKKVNNFMMNNKKLFDINEIIEVNYGENITGYLSQPSEDLTWIDEEIINYKKQLKNKRKPTDILIFTDGYSFSAACTFLKYFQYYGGGIVAGFFGNPKENNIPFDSGQSSSSIFENETLFAQSPIAYKILHDKYNISFKMPGNQNFFDDLNLSLPLEYMVSPVDERVEIYHHFKDNKYDLFINEAKKIFNKYKTKCNPKNKKLVLITNKCDGKFENKYTHGGYECGDTGLWTDKCVPSYCDADYVFNYKLKKCTKREKGIKILIYILLLFLCLIVYYILEIEKEENKEDSEEELIDLSNKSEFIEK